jgi:sporulation protein YlmC with PRC-barrel domain
MATTTVGLMRLGDSSLGLAAGERDVSGYSVVDPAGRAVGKVTALYVDETNAKVRFLQVRGGGFLGIGQKDSMVPIEAVDRAADWVVHLNHSRQKVSGAPTYDPDLVAQRSYWDDLYRWYGYPPFWTAASR